MPSSSSSIITMNCKAAHYLMDGTIDATTNWLGSDQAILDFDTFNFLTIGNDSINFPLGTTGFFFISISVFGFGLTSRPTINLANAVINTAFNNNTLDNIGSSANTDEMVLNFSIVITNPLLIATVFFTSGTYPASISGGDIYVMQMAAL